MNSADTTIEKAQCEAELINAMNQGSRFVQIIGNSLFNALAWILFQIGNVLLVVRTLLSGILSGTSWIFLESGNAVLIGRAFIMDNKLPSKAEAKPCPSGS
jgi:hypothetical protein